MGNSGSVLVMAVSALTASSLSSYSLAAEQAVSAGPVQQAEQDPQVAEIDNVLLYRRLTRLGMVTQNLAYSLEVSAEGQVTACNLGRKFRSAFTTKQICRALTDAIQFVPARDAQGMAVNGTYSGEVDLLTFFTPNR